MPGYGVAVSAQGDDVDTRVPEREPGPGPALRWSRRNGALLLGPALALVLGLWGITATPLWLDEMATAEAVQEGLASHRWEPQSLPGYAVFLAWTTVAGHGDLALRLLPLAATVVAVLLTALTASRLAGRRAGVAAGVLMALLPSVMRYAQEARVYALVLALAAAATFVLPDVVTGRRGARVWYPVLVAALGVLHPVGLTIVVAHAVLVVRPVAAGILPMSAAATRAWRLWAIPALIGVVPGVLLAWQWRSASGLISWVQKPSSSDPIEQIVGIVPSGAWLSRAGLLIALLMVAAAMLARAGRCWLVAWLVPVALVWLFSFGVTSVWVGRYLLPLAPIAVLACIMGLQHLSPWWLVGLILAVGAIAAPVAIKERAAAARSIDYREAALVVAEQARPGDSLVTGPGWRRQYAAFGIERYLPEGTVLRAVDQPTAGSWFLADMGPCPSASSQTWSVAGGTLTRCG